MKGDFSRVTFPDKRYSSVRMQQGRTILDSDWNEQAEIRERSERNRFQDAVGRVGAPRADGFALHVRQDGELEVSSGRLYVGGVACELDASALLSELARDGLVPTPGATDLVYVNAWERDVSAIEDPDLLEPALEGVDTSTRLQVAWTIEALRDVGDVSCSDAIDLLSRGEPGAMCAAVPGGYAGTENHLYRVEIHDGGTVGSASFKWSRDNGSVVFAIAEFLGPETVRISPTWQRTGQRLHIGDWVEVSGSSSDRAGSVGTLARIEDVGDSDNAVRFDRAVSRHREEEHPYLRRWDQRDGPTLPVLTDRVELESGVEIRFADGLFHTGDYWTVAARPGARPIEWSEPVPPEGVERWLAPLALVTWGSSGPVVQDCRRVFRPLTDVEAELVHLRREVEELRGLLQSAL